jgi:hypothetical protein
MLALFVCGLGRMSREDREKSTPFMHEKSSKFDPGASGTFLWEIINWDFAADVVKELSRPFRLCAICVRLKRGSLRGDKSNDDPKLRLIGLGAPPLTTISTDGIQRAVEFLPSRMYS